MDWPMVVFEPKCTDRLASQFPREFVQMLDPYTGRITKDSLQNQALRIRQTLVASDVESMCAELRNELMRRRTMPQLAGHKRTREGTLLPVQLETKKLRR